ncbi:hypothetical protein [Microbulbifer taiwanensis]|uniref:Uncharacterized protein n=1 Tax=Microbulbifer taiwanensis TaxID=986746 RepID=A0ABW1YQ45_9GAMM|nr:hypothetical protein [Microbulbifer taiwanensis]
MTSAALASLGIDRLPTLIAEPADSSSEDHRRNCLAWYLITNRTRGEVLEWLGKQHDHTRTDMRGRLNQLREQVNEMRREVAGA